MKMQDVLPKMSKLYLNRVVGSFLKDVRLDDEAEMREVILKNIKEFKNEERVLHNLDFAEEPRDVDVLSELILICLIQADDYLLSGADLIKALMHREQQIVSDSEDDEYVQTAIPNFSYRVYKPVLEAAWNKDESLNAHEKNILTALRHELRLSRRHHRLIESRIGRFPQKNNKLHSINQIENTLRILQSKGLVLRFRTDDEYFVIPEEIARTVRYEVGGELREDGYRQLLDNLRVDQLRNALSGLDLSMSGTKATLIDRIIRFDASPSQVLQSLNNSELADILRSLESARISGTKDERIHELIDYYEALASPITSDPTDERAIFYDFFHELACRDYRTLRSNNVIDKDIDIDQHFEGATHYLFEKSSAVLRLICKEVDAPMGG